jgi:hypothetical protein
MWYKVPEGMVSKKALKLCLDCVHFLSVQLSVYLSVYHLSILFLILPTRIMHDITIPILQIRKQTRMGDWLTYKPEQT